MEPSIFALPVMIAGLSIKSCDKIILVFLICLVFGGTATLSLAALGGAPVVPAVLFFPFVMWKALNDQPASGGISQLFYPKPGFWLMLLVIYEVFSAYALPRMFEGETLVYSADRGVLGGVPLLPLKPVSTNLTQSFYAILGFVAFFAINKLQNSPARLIAFRKGVLTMACIDILAALIQLGESYLGLPPILAEVRNANYAMFGNDELGGLIRLQGTFPEASAFSAFTLPLFAFAFTLYRQHAIPAYSGSLALILLCLLLISTSTTTYFSLALYLMCNFLMFIGGVFTKGPNLKLGKIAAIVWLFLVLICLLLLTSAELTAQIIDFFDLTLFNKLESSSGKERSAWNWQGLLNLVDTYGIGVGFASNRSSNFFVALISNVGVIGSCLFAAFLWKTAFSRTKGLSTAESQVIIAAKHAVFISLFSLFASSAFADPGMLFYVFAAVASAGSNLNLTNKAKVKAEHELMGLNPINS